MFNFKEKTVLITGASYGLGEQFAYSFADAGADLILTARSEELLQGVGEVCREKGRKVTVVTGDVSQIDLPKDSQSGLKDCLEFILNIKGIDAVKFGPKDVMRHKIVSSIVSEYEKRKKNKD